MAVLPYGDWTDSLSGCVSYLVVLCFTPVA